MMIDRPARAALVDGDPLRSMGVFPGPAVGGRPAKSVGKVQAVASSAVGSRWWQAEQAT